MVYKLNDKKTACGANKNEIIRKLKENSQTIHKKIWKWKVHSNFRDNMGWWFSRYVTIKQI